MASEKGKRPFFKYKEEDMEKAIAAVKEKTMSYAGASRAFDVPRVTLMRKVKEDKSAKKKMGPPTVLSENQENRLVKWIHDVGKLGFPLIREDLLCTVKKIVENTGQTNPFKDGKPGKKWFAAFLRRHPQLTERVAEQLTASRASVTEKQIRSWFEEVKSYLKANDLYDVLLDPTRIYNADESSFNLCPKSGKVLSVKGESNVYEVICGSGKEALTVLINIRADGGMTPPFILYPYVRIPAEVIKNVPDDWAIGKNESGWMTSETFYEYICNVFYPWIVKEKVKLPVILFMDGHKSHLTVHLSEFCSEKQIILVALYPNTTHILQPCDTSVFRPMKVSWKNTVHKWRADHSYEPVTKQNFAQLFSVVISSVKPETINHGFRNTGLFPFDPDSVDFSKCSPSEILSNAVVPEPQVVAKSRRKEIENITGHLTYLESLIVPDKLTHFNICFNEAEEWNGEECAKDLYNVWKEMKSKVNFQDLENSTQTISAESSQANSSLQDTNEVSEGLQIELNDVGISYASPAKVSVNILDEETTSSVGSPFKRALYYPEKPATTKKKKRNTEKVPSVITSNEWKKYCMQKENVKNIKEQEKEKRRLEREAKKREKEQNTKEIQKCRKSQNKKATASLENETETEESEIDMCEDSSDNIEISESDDSIESPTKRKRKTEDLQLESYYAVHYDDHLPSIGRIISINENICKMKFLKQIMDNTFNWPSKDDVQDVNMSFILYGPLKLMGNGPFSVTHTQMLKIRAASRAFKICTK